MLSGTVSHDDGVAGRALADTQPEASTMQVNTISIQLASEDPKLPAVRSIAWLDADVLIT